MSRGPRNTARRIPPYIDDGDGEWNNYLVTAPISVDEKSRGTRTERFSAKIGGKLTPSIHTHPASGLADNHVQRNNSGLVTHQWGWYNSRNQSGSRLTRNLD